MTENTYIAINSDALFSKSKVYIGRALTKKSTEDLDEYQLWASLALELLGKAALADKHPSLVVDPNSWQSLFVAAGINITTDVKTISAKTLYERLTHLIPTFDKAVLQKFCIEIAERRNTELHSADLPFQAMHLDAWETRYWHACDTILQYMDSSLEQWLGADDARAPRQFLNEAAQAHEKAIIHRIEAAKDSFNALPKKRKKVLTTEPKNKYDLFKGSFDEIWEMNCPACNSVAFMGGDQTSEEISQEYDEYAIWEIVNLEFLAEEFHCPVCELALIGNNEIDFAGLDSFHEDQQEREIEYEPDYGND